MRARNFAPAGRALAFFFSLPGRRARDKSLSAFSTAKRALLLKLFHARAEHNPATPIPNSRPNQEPRCAWDANQTQRMANDQARRTSCARASRNHIADCKLQSDPGEIPTRARRVFPDHDGERAQGGSAGILVLGP